MTGFNHRPTPRVLWQNEHYPDPIKGGGGAVNTYYIVRELDRLGCATVILARATRPSGSALENINGTRVLRLDSRRPPDVLWPIWPTLSAAYLRPALAETARSFDAFVCVDSPYVLALKRLHPDRPLVCRVEGTTRGHDAAVRHTRGSSWSPREWKHRALRRLLMLENDLLDRIAWRRADALVVKSEFMKRDLTRLYGLDPRRIHVIPNGVDHERYARARPRPDILERVGGSGRVVITFAGRLVKMKNLAFLLRAYASMRSREQCLLLLVGDGDQQAALMEEARRLGVAADVRFIGHTDRVEEYLTASHIFVLPSNYEPFGNALVEAMAAGLPCLALRPDGVSVRTASAEIISDGESGYLVDGRDPAALAEKLDLLAGNPALRARLGQAGQRIAADRYSWRRCAEAYLGLLRLSADSWAMTVTR